MIVESFKFLPRTFRPLYEGGGPFPGEEAAVWAPFKKRLAESRIALLTSAGIYLKQSQPAFDLEREQTHPEWGDPSWRPVPAASKPEDLGVAHLHINDADLLADPEIALPMDQLGELASEGVVGGAVAEHVAVMGYQDRSLSDWREKDGARGDRSPSGPGCRRSHPRSRLTRLLLERARAGTVDRGGGNSDRDRDDGAVGG